MKVVLYEDKSFENLYPLTYVRPTFELRCGMYSLKDRILKRTGASDCACFVRDWLVDSYSEKTNHPVNEINACKNNDLLIVNGALLRGELPTDAREEVGLKDEEIVYISVKKETVASLSFSTFEELVCSLEEKLPGRQVDALLIKYPWDLVNENPPTIESDFETITDKGVHGNISSQALIYEDTSKVYIGKGAQIHPFVVLDTHSGPVIIDEDVTIFPFVRIEGPAYIGKESQIMSGANIREGTSLGPVCRVGGEVEESIIHGHSNKYHDGFLGHAYVCEWVNLGAITTNSDLKNDYKTIQVYLNGNPVDTGSTKIGCYIGDHTKTSIGTFINSGTVIGTMCLILGESAGVMPKYVPPFVWFIGGKPTKGFGFTSLIETAKVSMSRRGANLTENDEKLLRYIWKISKQTRTELIKKARKQ